MLFDFSGTVRQRWRTCMAESRCDIEIVLHANHILVTNLQRNDLLITQELVKHYYIYDLIVFLEFFKSTFIILKSSEVDIFSD